MKRLLIIAYGRLITNGTAGHTVMCGLTEAAVEAGWDVTYLGLQPAGHATDGDLLSPIAKHQRVKTCELPYSTRKPASLFERAASLFEPGRLESPVGPLPDLGMAFDRLVAFDSLPRLLARRYEAKDRLLILGDPVGERLQYAPVPPTPPWSWFGTSKSALLGKVVAIIDPLYQRKALIPGSRPAMFGTGHAGSWSAALGRTVIDLRPFIPACGDLPEHHPNPDQIILSFGGTLGGTASRNSLEFLFDHFLPALASPSPFARHELQIVGSIPPDLRARLEGRPKVSLLGRVPDFEATLAGADVFLVPMDYPVGVRTRVCSALQAGCFCICHASILYNMPELRDCPAVRIAPDHAGILAAIADYPADPDQRRSLRREARAFFDRFYRSDVAAAPLLRKSFNE